MKELDELYERAMEMDAKRHYYTSDAMDAQIAIEHLSATMFREVVEALEQTPLRKPLYTLGKSHGILSVSSP